MDRVDSTGVLPTFPRSKELWDTETSVSASAFPVLLQRPIDKLMRTSFNGNSDVLRGVHVFEILLRIRKYVFCFLLLSSKNVCQG